MAYAESVLQDPCRSGSPHGVRGSPLAAFDAVAALDPVAALCPVAGRATSDTEMTKPASVHAVVTHGFMWISPLAVPARPERGRCQICRASPASNPDVRDRIYRLSLS